MSAPAADWRLQAVYLRMLRAAAQEAAIDWKALGPAAAVKFPFVKGMGPVDPADHQRLQHLPLMDSWRYGAWLVPLKALLSML